VTAVDTFARARKVADAVLYEGYVLYPYRASSRKNQIRWQFGVVAPRAFAERDPSEDWAMQTEILVDPGMDARLDVRIRFLRVQERVVEQATADGGFEPVASLEVDGSLLTTWDEAVEEEINVTQVALSDLFMAERTVPIEFPYEEHVEPFEGGRIVRRRQALKGVLRIAGEMVPARWALAKVRVRVENVTDFDEWPAGRDDVCRRSLAAVHTLMAVAGGRFISLADVPEFARQGADSCVNLHTWPVLIGDVGQRDVILSSPVTLSDYPEVAPESPGDMFDACEIDEILALRVMTLTEDEKREARSTDPKAAAIIDRCDILPEEVFERLHGAVRYLKDAGPRVIGEATDDEDDEVDLVAAPAFGTEPWPPVMGAEPSPRGEAARAAWWTPEAEGEVDPFGDRVWVGPVSVGAGSRVILRPSRRADAHDLFLAGREAEVQAVFKDVDGNTQVAVSVMDDDGQAYQIGHGRYLFFFPDEVEPVGAA